MNSALLWFVYYPLLKIIYAFTFWIPELVERQHFERKNLTDPFCRSFKKDHLKADYCFEFSSEGEYQQVASLIEDALKLGKKIELVFFSLSVEKAITELAQRYPQSIRYLRYPLVTFGPGKNFTAWISSPELVMVRYDLFPELLFWAMGSAHKLTMVWMTFKKERMKGKEISWFKKLFLKHAHKIIFATPEDLEQGRMLGLNGVLYDFRMEQIKRRIQGRHEKLQKIFPQYARLKQIWEKYPREKRILIGNAWPSDLKVIEELPEDHFVLVVPHQLRTEILDSFRESFTAMDRELMEVHEGSVEIAEAQDVLLNKKGILCELYADFGKAYVGGGFEGSIHSVLEPLVAGVELIACGPAHHRSTEYDLARSFGQMTEINTAEDFSRWTQKKSEEKKSANSMEAIMIEYPERRKEVLSC